MIHFSECVAGGARKYVDGKSHCSGCDTGGGSGREGGQTSVQRGIHVHGAQGGVTCEPGEIVALLQTFPIGLQSFAWDSTGNLMTPTPCSGDVKKDAHSLENIMPFIAMVLV
jgi:hypothetical protein